MKGWQNNIIYVQKINCAKELVSKIISFEQFEFLQVWQDGLIKYEVPLLHCFNLQHLIDSLKLNYIKIYKGQILIIANQILLHLQQLHSHNLNNLSHGNLEPKNIFISLRNNRNNKLTIYQVPIHIKRINFINYKAIEDENYQVNQIADIQQIIKSIQQFIQVVEDYTQCQLLQLINNSLQSINNNIHQNTLKELCILFNQLITNYVDIQTQQIKKGLFKESPNYESLLSYRYRSESVIINYLESLSMWDFFQIIDIQQNQNLIQEQNEQIIQQNQIFLQNSDQDDQDIKSILFNLLRNTVMLQFWAVFGEKFSSWTFNSHSIFQDFQNKINIYLLQLPIWYQEIKDVLIQCQNQIPINIIDEIQKSFKFDFEINSELKFKIAQLFYQQLLIQFDNFDFFANDMDELLNLIRESITEEVRKYYDEQTKIKFYEIAFDLI